MTMKQLFCRGRETFWKLSLTLPITIKDICRDFARNDIHNLDTKWLHFSSQGISVVMQRCFAGIVACLALCQIKYYEPTTKRITSIYIGYNPSNRANIDNSAFCSHNHGVKMMDHTHWAENIDCKHLLYFIYICICGCHCVTCALLSCVVKKANRPTNSCIIDKNVKRAMTKFMDSFLKLQHISIASDVAVYNMNAFFSQMLTRFEGEQSRNDNKILFLLFSSVSRLSSATCIVFSGVKPKHGRFLLYHSQ